MVIESAQITKLEDKMIDLQSQLAFQEDTVQALNEIVTQQQGQIERLNEMMLLLKHQLDQPQFEPGAGVSPAEERPPHY